MASTNSGFLQNNCKILLYLKALAHHLLSTAQSSGSFSGTHCVGGSHKRGMHKPLFRIWKPLFTLQLEVKQE